MLLLSEPMNYRQRHCVYIVLGLGAIAGGFILEAEPHSAPSALDAAVTRPQLPPESESAPADPSPPKPPAGAPTQHRQMPR